MLKKVGLEIKNAKCVIYVLIYNRIYNTFNSAFGKLKKGVEDIRFYYFSQMGYYLRLETLRAIESGMDLPC